MSKIKSISATEIKNSRGEATLQTEVVLESGEKAVASVPAGASTGQHEAHSIDTAKAIENVHGVISDKLVGQDATNQQKIDWLMKELDGTDNKSELGANAILSVSLAVARASALLSDQPLYQYISTKFDFPWQKYSLPQPMFNLMNGGAHGGNNISIQEFMVLPIGDSFKEKLNTGIQLLNQLEKTLADRNQPVEKGDEGGFKIELTDPKEVLELLITTGKAINLARDRDYKFALDIAASEFCQENDGKYAYTMKGYDPLDSKEFANYILELARDYGISSIEDPLGEDDWEGWQYLSKRADSNLKIIGDDIFTTNLKRLKIGIEKGVANSIIIKPNQIGTLTETIETVKLAQEKHYSIVVSHRSGETKDSFIADLAVGIKADHIKFGAPEPAERLSKYNRLVEIEKELEEG